MISNIPFLFFQKSKFCKKILQANAIGSYTGNFVNFYLRGADVICSNDDICFGLFVARTET